MAAKKAKETAEATASKEEIRALLEGKVDSRVIEILEKLAERVAALESK